MARKKRKPPPEPQGPVVQARKPRSRPVWGTVFFVLGIVFAYYLWHYDPKEVPSLNTDANPEAVGWVGANLAYVLFFTVGAIAWLIPFFAFWAGYAAFFPTRQRLRATKIAWMILGLLAAAVIGTQAQETLGFVQNHVTEAPDNYYPYGLGGLVGDSSYGQLSSLLGPFPTFLILLGMFSVAAVGLFNVNLREFLGGFWQRLRERKAADPRPKSDAAGKKSPPQDEKSSAPAPESSDIFAPVSNGRSSSNESGKKGFKLHVPKKKSAESAKEKPEKEEEKPARVQIVEAEKVERVRTPAVSPKGNYVPPSTDLLAEPPDLDGQQSPEEHQQIAADLVSVLDQFGVKVKAGEIHTGPVITRYEVVPEPGVRVEKIANLDKNIALGLKAPSVRILAPVPGRGTVGIELPNRQPASVNLREIVESKAWVESKADIPIALGKEVSGRPLITDLSKMPHLLIAGATGAGKTVCINSIVASLLYHAGPEELRFVMVDPKIVEMQVYNDLPHMLIPVVTEPRKVPAALKYLLREMEHRYQMFAQAGVRNIAGFNNRKKKLSLEEQKASEADLSPEERAALNSVEVSDEQEKLPEKLPYIVTIVDELADLMMVAPAEVEQGIARLAQLARAAGIHLIVATQRPSVNVITGLIKANLPSRIAFKVAAKVDSRTILDGNGADQLIGRGDMLFLPPGSHDLLRAQGCFVSDDEINHLVGFLKEKNGEPIFDDHFQAQVESSLEVEGEEEGDDDGDGDEDSKLRRKAIEVIKSSKRASTSMLQRRLRIGYNRAARIMDQLEDEGIVGPDNGSSPREILRDPDSL